MQVMEGSRAIQFEMTGRGILKILAYEAHQAEIRISITGTCDNAKKKKKSKPNGHKKKIVCGGREWAAIRGCKGKRGLDIY